MGEDISKRLDEQVESAAAAAELAHVTLEAHQSLAAKSRGANAKRASDARLDASERAADAADAELSDALDQEEDHLRRQSAAAAK